jgi:SAM-dependent methyltransferase
MSALAESLRERYFGDDEHPYATFERRVDALLRPEHTLLDAGCGRTAPVLVKYRGKARRLIGVDLVDFPAPVPGVELRKGDLANVGVPDESVDIVMSRSVMEHVTDPAAVYAEMHRILRPGGGFVFLTGNFWDYAALMACAVPNRFHPWIVRRTEGREEEDVFPTAYRTNTRRAVRRWAAGAGFAIESFDYLGQYPSYFMFNGALFLAATGYEKLLRRVPPLKCLQGWILAVLRKPA